MLPEWIEGQGPFAARDWSRAIEDSSQRSSAGSSRVVLIEASAVCSFLTVGRKSRTDCFYKV